MPDAMEPVNPFREGAAGRYFVGRDDELKRFTRAFTALRNDEPAHLYVAGVNGRGKTSYLEKLVELADSGETLAVRVALDGGVRAQQQIRAMFEELLRKIDETHRQRTGAARLIGEWKRSDGSPFQLPGAGRLQNHHVLQDLTYVRNVVAELGFRHVVLCIDEGERIEPYALSALKNALLELKEYLVVLSIRLADDGGDAVRAGKLVLEKIAVDADRDLGAARLFVGGVGLGTFTASQSRDCIARRLEGNAIRFDDDVVDLIARVADGLPDRIISYAHEVYDRTDAADADTATVEIFRRTFVATHQFELDETRALAAQSTSSDRRTLRELARHGDPLTPLELARRIYPTVPAEALEPVAEALRGVLDRVGHPVRATAEGRYQVADPVRRYAMEMATEPQ